MNKSKKEFLLVIGFLVAFFVAIFSFGTLWNFVGYNFEYSQGERVGQVVKLSEKGLFWKTWEGAMGLTQSGAYVEYWNFSVDARDPNKDELVKDLNEALFSGDLVKVNYEQRYGSVPWRSETPYWIKSVEPLQKH